MSNNTDSNKYTILFAIGMVVVVGSLLAFTASSLKPNIVENERMEKQQNILYAMGVNENGATDIVFVGTDKVADEFSKYIAKQLQLFCNVFRKFIGNLISTNKNNIGRTIFIDTHCIEYVLLLFHGKAAKHTLCNGCQ